MLIVPSPAPLLDIPHWAYLRRSQNEENDPHVLDRHRVLLLRLAQQDDRSLLPPHIYEEIGSGELIDTRPAFLTLLQLWEHLPRDAGGIVYVVELSRLTRGLLSDQGRVEDALMRAHVLIRTPNRTYDLRLFEDRLQFHIHGLIANAEYELIKQRFARAKHEMLLQGLPRNGSVPWGYRRVAGAVQPSDAFFALVRCCREIHQCSIPALSARYNVPRSTLYNALTNPFICGWPAKLYIRTDQRRTCGKQKGGALFLRGPRKEWLWPEKENTSYPHACTREEWEAIQETLTRRRTRPEKTATTNGWAKDIVCFEGCDQPVKLAGYTGYGGPYPTYRAGSLSVARDLVHAAAEAAIQAILTNPGALSAAIRDWQAMTREQALKSPPGSSVEELMAARDRHQRQAVELLQRELDAGSVEAETIRLLRQKKEAEIERLTGEIQEARQRVPVPCDLEFLLPRLPALARYWEQVWPQTTDAEKREIANRIIEKLVVRVEPGERKNWLRRTILPPIYREWLATLPCVPGLVKTEYSGNVASLWEKWPWAA